MKGYNIACMERGHMYLFINYDGCDVLDRQVITFFKRIGEKYPGNSAPAHAGTNCQDVIRVLIDRIGYLDNQIPSEHDKKILWHLRESLNALELRAAERHGLTDEYNSMWGSNIGTAIENIPYCTICGHIVCRGHDSV